jgi:hypothetical protein
MQSIFKASASSIVTNGRYEFTAPNLFPSEAFVLVGALEAPVVDATAVAGFAKDVALVELAVDPSPLPSNCPKQSTDVASAQHESTLLSDRLLQISQTPSACI